MNDCGCPLNSPDLSGVEQLNLRPAPRLDDYRAALALARHEAETHLGENLLISWYDRDRDFESPAHTTEAACGPKNGYLRYGRAMAAG